MPIKIDPNSLKRESSASQWKIEGKLEYTTYATGGSPVNAVDLGLSQIKEFEVDSAAGYLFDPVINPANSVCNLKVFQGAGGPWTQTPLPADALTIYHEAAHAVNAARMYVIGYQDNLAIGQGWWLTADQYGVNNFQTNAGILVTPRGTTLISDQFERLLHDPAAPADGTRVFWRPSANARGQNNLGRFVSANSTGQNQIFQLVDSVGTGTESVIVYFDPNAANDSYPIAVDEAAATGSRLVLSHDFDIPVYVQTQNGRYLKIENGAVAALPVLYFNDIPADPRDRLIFISPGAVNTTNSTLTSDGLADIEKLSVFPLFCNEAETNPQNRLQCDFGGLANDGVYLPIGERILHIAHNTNASIDGVSVVYDPALPLAQKLRFISPTLTDALAPLDPYRQPVGGLISGTTAGAASEVPNLTDLSALGLIDFQAWGL